MSSTSLYTDLSRYYDLMCTDINYFEQSDYVCRLHQLLGNGGKRHLDLGCGTGPHIRRLMDSGYQSSGLDIHQPMLDIARRRCPEAHFFQGDMSSFTASEPFDLITCFLYSIHYTQTIGKLEECFAAVHAALNAGGVFCFNAVDKTTIDNKDGAYHAIERDGSQFVFRSSWRYPAAGTGSGDRQQLLVRIEKTEEGLAEIWEDQHQMVAVSFQEIQKSLEPLFEVYVFEHVYDRIEPWSGVSGNAVFVCVKKEQRTGDLLPEEDIRAPVARPVKHRDLKALFRR